jgi:hypothetical protein
MPRISSRAAIGLVVALVVAVATTAAFASGSQRYAVSKSPYWQVGELNKELSNACRKLVFNEEKSLALSIGYNGDKGMGITGVAKKGWNLYDPFSMAKPDVTYHFRNDGYSNCEVFVAGQPKRRR